MRILVWSPFINLGGGYGLLSRLVPAIAQLSDVRSLKLAVPPDFFSLHDLNAGSNSSIEIIELKPNFVQSWLRKNTSIFGIKGSQRLKLSLRWRIEPKILDRVYSEQIRRLAKDVDIVYVFWPHLLKYSALNKPIVCTFQDATYFEFPELLGGANTNKEWHRANTWLRNADRVIVSSEATKNLLIKHFGDFCESTIVIHHAISTLKPHSDDELSDAFPKDIPERYILFPGNITAHKNHYTLLTAWAQFERRQEIPLVFIGEGIHILRDDWPLEANIETQQDRLVGLVKRIGLHHGNDYFALGYVEDVVAVSLLKNATALIMPTLAEGGGSYPVEEALSLGIPVLCADIPVLREHLADRSAKIAWFDPLSIDSILLALHDMLENYPTYKDSALRAMHDVRPTWDDVAKKYVSVFNSVLK